MRCPCVGMANVLSKRQLRMANNRGWVAPLASSLLPPLPPPQPLPPPANLVCSCMTLNDEGAPNGPDAEWEGVAAVTHSLSEAVPPNCANLLVTFPAIVDVAPDDEFDAASTLVVVFAGPPLSTLAACSIFNFQVAIGVRCIGRIWPLQPTAPIFGWRLTLLD